MLAADIRQIHLLPMGTIAHPSLVAMRAEIASCSIVVAACVYEQVCLPEATAPFGTLSSLAWTPIAISARATAARRPRGLRV